LGAIELIYEPSQKAHKIEGKYYVLFGNMFGGIEVIILSGNSKQML